MAALLRRLSRARPERAHRLNREIRAPRIRVVDDTGAALGVMTVDRGMLIARDRGLDLVEIVPGATPPVCRITDYGKLCYDLKKKKKAAEAAKKAQEIHGTPDITPAMMRDGMEALAITEADMAALGLPDFGPEFSVSCDNHGGSGLGKVQQWDAGSSSWSVITDWIESDKSVIDPLVSEDSAAYAAENNIKERCN